MKRQIRRKQKTKLTLFWAVVAAPAGDASRLCTLARPGHRAWKSLGIAQAICTAVSHNGFAIWARPVTGLCWLLSRSRVGRFFVFISAGDSFVPDVTQLVSWSM